MGQRRGGGECEGCWKEAGSSPSHPSSWQAPGPANTNSLSQVCWKKKKSIKIPQFKADTPNLEAAVALGPQAGGVGPEGSILLGQPGTLEESWLEEGGGGRGKGSVLSPV